MASENAPTTVLDSATFLCFSGGSYVGAESRTLATDGETLTVSDGTQIRIERFGETVQATFSHTETLDLAGALRTFHSTIQMGGAPMVYSGTVADSGDLQLEIQSFGRTDSRTFPANGATLVGYCATDTSLFRQPMKLHEKRSMTRFDPTVMARVTLTLECVAAERTRVFSGAEFPLYKILSESVYHTGSGTAGAQTETVWADADGRIWKRYSPVLNLSAWRVAGEEAERCTKMGFIIPEHVARDAECGGSGQNAQDFGDQANVPLVFENGTRFSFSDVHEAVYVVRARNSADIASIFENSEHQRVEKLSASAVQITVRDSDLPPIQSVQRPVLPDDTEPGSLIQSDDAEVVRLAEVAAGGETEPSKIAQNIERFVFDFILDKNYSRGFVTAAEVARDPAGDCTEHAILFAALARARGLPTRVAQGLIYVRDSEAMSWHVWNEVAWGGTWHPLDATLGHGSVACDHLRINAGSFSGDTLAATLMPAATLIGNIEIQVRQNGTAGEE